MPNEFGGLERVSGKVSNLASKVKGWIESISWDAPSQFGKDNPFKDIKNFEQLNQKYLELRSNINQQQLPLINMFYSSQRAIIIKNFITILRKIQSEYKVVNEKKKELKMTDATVRMSEEQFKKEFPNYEDPKATKEEKPQETAQQKAVKERIKELDNDLKQLLTTLGVYKTYAISDIYNSDKNEFINRLVTSLNNSLTKQNEKTNLFKQEVETGKQLPKKEKTVNKQTDSAINTAYHKTIKVKIKSK